MGSDPKSKEGMKRCKSQELISSASLKICVWRLILNVGISEDVLGIFGGRGAWNTGSVVGTLGLLAGDLSNFWVGESLGAVEGIAAGTSGIFTSMVWTSVCEI